MEGKRTRKERENEGEEEKKDMRVEGIRGRFRFSQFNHTTLAYKPTN